MLYALRMVYNVAPPLFIRHIYISTDGTLYFLFSLHEYVIVHRYGDAGELSLSSYTFQPSVLELRVGRFSSVSPKLNLCSNSTANKGTTCSTGHSVLHIQHAYEDLCWWLKMLPLHSDWRGAVTGIIRFCLDYYTSKS